MQNSFTNLPPGSFGLPLIGETFNLFLDPQFAQKRHQKYGTIFKTCILGQPTCFLYGAEAAKFIMSNENNYFVSYFPPTARTLLGLHTLSSQVGEVHQNRRKLLYSAFNTQILVSFIQVIEEITQYYLKRWLKMENFTWYPELRSYTFDLAAKFLIGLDEASKTPLRDLYESLGEGLFALPLRLPWTKFGRALHSRQQLLTEIEKLIQQRQVQHNFGSDALGILLKFDEQQSEVLTVDEIQDQILGLLLAGHGTLASALTSFCLLVAKHPEVLEKLVNEQKQFMDKPLSLEQLKQMVYLEQVTKEVLRLIPPVGGVFRKVIKDCEFQGYLLPKGWNILYQITLTHQDSTIYDLPQLFQPERFNSRQSPFSYKPFGGGIRECLGRELANLEIKVFAALLVRSYHWELLPNQNLNIQIFPIPVPKDGLKVQFQAVKKL